MNKLVPLCLLACLFPWPAGAQVVELEQSWSRPDAPRREHTKAIVVGITSDEQVRRVFENRFVSHLRGFGIECLTSHSIVPSFDEVDDPTDVARTLTERDVDAVITVRLLPQGKNHESWSVDDWQERVEDERGIRQHVERSLPLSEVKARRYVVDFALWDRESQARIWAARTAAEKMSRLKKRPGEIVQQAIRSLRSSDLL